MTIAHPIARAWLTTGGRAGQTTAAQNYDEFADDAEITAIIAANPASALAVEMPHRAPESLGRPFADCLPDAVARLATAKADGHYAQNDDVAVVYRITSPEGSRGYGLWTMVETAQISTSADEPGLVIRNEDVFLEKVRERVALAQATGHLLSPVLLLQTARGDDLHAALASAIAEAGAPAASDVDPAGRTHEIWALGADTTRDRLLDLAGGGELVVADGNHRSLAAQTAGLPRFLAVVTTPGSVAIQPYNRLVSELGMAPADLVARLAAAGATVTPLAGTTEVPNQGGVVHLYTAAGAWAVTLPTAGSDSAVDNLDHALVERHLLGDALGLEPGDKRITYVGGDYPADWLRGEVDSGRAELAVLIAPVTVGDFVAVNLARQKMPRKSTWFTPKARAGLVVADLAAEA
ncbi:DUF1015 family protein [Planosporangium mesophilum]|uniref:DUF1015 domain-containing protein n=1 Tax=Planosporangium mesophilum TaxID=689768 RepID=A0A8J3TFM3_9ACTN|nr:DUF1015 family protein [Planosporangium mesophilum]NJC86050.1 DUF1015 domain-containing protein [Planosporangium mesophilum]GII25558.1 hypothetical protein Pme01_51550 [Planosporangium mesophilum]